ncbi:MAG: short-chain dehydrogenase/reductase [Sphingomonas bacterium]|nr:short-chain dehydrogenase/reductase [Sphingomonas bacterium]
MAMLEGRMSRSPARGAGWAARSPCCARAKVPRWVNDPGVSSEGEGGDAGPAAQTVADIVAAGGQAHANSVSVTDPLGAASIVEEAVQRFGRIDAVVNNAGICATASGTR